MHSVEHLLKINRHTKKQKNMICDQQKNQSIERDTKLTDMILADKTLKQPL